MAEEALVAMWASMASWYTPTALFLFLNLMIGTIALSAKFTSQKNQPQQPRDDDDNNNNPTQQHLFRPTSLLERVRSINFSVYRSGSSESATTVQQYSEVAEPQYTNSEVVEQTQYSNSNSGHAPTQQLAGTPSLIDRVKSFNFSFIGYQQSDEANEARHPNMNLGSDSDSYTDNPSVRAELASYREEAEIEKSVREKPSPRPPSSDQAPTKMEKSVREKPAPRPPSSGQVPTTKMEESVSEKTEKRPKPIQAAPVKLMMRSLSEKLKFWRAEEDENVEVRRPATVRGGFETVSYAEGDEPECVNEKADDFINRFRNQLKLQRLDSMTRYKDMITRGSSR